MVFAAQAFLQSLTAASLVSLGHNGLSVQAQWEFSQLSSYSEHSEPPVAIRVTLFSHRPEPPAAPRSQITPLWHCEASTHSYTLSFHKIHIRDWGGPSRAHTVCQTSPFYHLLKRLANETMPILVRSIWFKRNFTKSALNKSIPAIINFICGNFMSFGLSNQQGFGVLLVHHHCLGNPPQEVTAAKKVCFKLLYRRGRVPGRQAQCKAMVCWGHESVFFFRVWWVFENWNVIPGQQTDWDSCSPVANHSPGSLFLSRLLWAICAPM